MTNYGFNGNDMDEAQPSIPTTANTPEQEAIIKNSTAIDSLRCPNEELLKMVQALSQALLQPFVSSQTTVPQPPKFPIPTPKPTSNIDPKRVTPPSSFSGPEDQSINGLSWIFQCTKYLERLGLLHDYGGVYEVSCLLKGPAATWYMSQETTFNRSYCTGEELLHDLKIWVTASTLASKPRDELASLCKASLWKNTPQISGTLPCKSETCQQPKHWIDINGDCIVPFKIKSIETVQRHLKWPFSLRSKLIAVPNDNITAQFP